VEQMSAQKNKCPNSPYCANAHPSLVVCTMILTGMKQYCFHCIRYQEELKEQRDLEARRERERKEKEKQQKEEDRKRRLLEEKSLKEHLLKNVHQLEQRKMEVQRQLESLDRDKRNLQVKSAVIIPK